MRLLPIATALFLAWTALPACAAMVVADDVGGKMEDYTSKFRQLRRSGETVVIDGKCLSACTMLLGMIPANRVCATQNAVLGFHAAWMYDTAGNRVASPAGTRDLMRTYPASVRAWIARTGGLRPEMMYLRGSALSAVVRPCSANDRTASSRPAESLRKPQASAPKRASRASFDAR
jgi:hypothetical protein